MNLGHVFDILNTDPIVASSFLGVISADQLDEPPLNNIDVYLQYYNNWSFISNTLSYREDDPAIGHWVAFHYNGHSLTFFDPLGGRAQDQPPHVTAEIKNFLQKFRDRGVPVHYLAEDGPLQSDGSSVCGEYCIYFIRETCRGKSGKQISQFLRRMDGEDRDDYVCQYVRNISPLAAEIMELQQQTDSD